MANNVKMIILIWKSTWSHTQCLRGHEVLECSLLWSNMGQYYCTRHCGSMIELNWIELPSPTYRPVLYAGRNETQHEAFFPHTPLFEVGTSKVVTLVNIKLSVRTMMASSSLLWSRHTHTHTIHQLDLSHGKTLVNHTVYLLPGAYR